MSDTIDLPAVGPVKKQWLYVGGALALGIVGYAWYQHAQSAGAAGDETPVDPEFENYGVDGGGSAGGTTTGGLAYTPPAETDPDDLPPTTNAAWVQRCVDYLSDVIGFDAQLVSTTLGKYLGRQPLTAVEADLVRTALGAVGSPPVGEYRIIMIGTPSTPTPPSTPSTPSTPLPRKDDPPATTPAPLPTKTAQYVAVTVVLYTTKNPPWNSTISGIASHYGTSTTAVWNDAKNAALRAKRGKPELIRPGDIVYVKTK